MVAAVILVPCLTCACVRPVPSTIYMVLPTHNAVLCFSALTMQPSVVTEIVLPEMAHATVMAPLVLVEPVVPVVLLESLPPPQAVINKTVAQVMAEKIERERIKILIKNELTKKSEKFAQPSG